MPELPVELESEFGGLFPFSYAILSHPRIPGSISIKNFTFNVSSESTLSESLV